MLSDMRWLRPRWALVLTAVAFVALGCAGPQETAEGQPALQTDTSDGTRATSATLSAAETPAATSVDPTAASGATPTPQPAACPLDDGVCVAARELEAMIAAGSGAIEARLMTTPYECPGVRPQGIGGPYPLCEGAVDGEVRVGFTYHNDVQGLTQSPEAAARWLAQASDASTRGMDWRVRTLSCRDGSTVAGYCSDVMVTLGGVDGGRLVSNSVLTFELLFPEKGGWQVVTYVNAGAFGNVAVALNGGSIDPPALHSAYDGFTRFLPWTT